MSCQSHCNAVWKKNHVTLDLVMTTLDCISSTCCTGITVSIYWNIDPRFQWNSDEILNFLLLLQHQGPWPGSIHLPGWCGPSYPRLVTLGDIVCMSTSQFRAWAYFHNLWQAVDNIWHSNILDETTIMSEDIKTYNTKCGMKTCSIILYNFFNIVSDKKIHVKETGYFSSDKKSSQ